ncbi:unnamed protein product [Protopolystoma xenopodis]|uniref:Uncharacterized protein n=1 Tax=Protopolystoma xenopodis TaxID=117903 RepID=A0A3S5AT19_9PLAT|nr:unnamed protein product [Protopolystoma xenopodis]
MLISCSDDVCHMTDRVIEIFLTQPNSRKDKATLLRYRLSLITEDFKNFLRSVTVISLFLPWSDSFSNLQSYPLCLNRIYQPTCVESVIGKPSDADSARPSDLPSSIASSVGAEAGGSESLSDNKIGSSTDCGFTHSDRLSSSGRQDLPSAGQTDPTASRAPWRHRLHPPPVFASTSASSAQPDLPQTRGRQRTMLSAEPARRAPRVASLPPGSLIEDRVGPLALVKPSGIVNTVPPPLRPGVLVQTASSSSDTRSGQSARAVTSTSDRAVGKTGNTRPFTNSGQTFSLASWPAVAGFGMTDHLHGMASKTGCPYVAGNEACRLHEPSDRKASQVERCAVAETARASQVHSNRFTIYVLEIISENRLFLSLIIGGGPLIYETNILK